MMMKKFKLLTVVFLFISFGLFVFRNAVSADEVSLPAESQQVTTLISLDVKSINLEDVLRLIADQSGLNIVASKNVRGTITVKLKDVPVEDALNAILDVNNCKYVKDGNIIKIYTYQDLQQEDRFAELTTKVYSPEYAKVTDLKPLLLTAKSNRGKIEMNAKTNQLIVSDTPEILEQIEDMIKELDREIELCVFELSYADPTEIQNKLNQFIPKTEGEIMVDTRTNSVIVKALPAVQKEIKLLIKKWDRQNKQVQIEAKMIEVTVDDSFQLGVNWEYQAPETLKSHEPISGADLKGDFSLGLTSGGIFKVGTLSLDDYTATLEMLASRVDTDVLSSPKITVLDGQEASILVGSSEPYVVTSEDPVTGFISESTNFIDVGIKLIVTPKIGEDNHITMQIHPEVSTARRVAEANNSLAVDTTQADTTLTVKNGETVVLGGLVKQDKKKTVKKVPFFGDIPILGLAFRSTDEENVKKELMVFITPHVLNAQGKIVEDKEGREIEEMVREIVSKIKNKREKEILMEQEY
ncbi:MAG: secretin N-terminal domain-containing protein [Candidatus Omnitrophota bacterium]